MESERLREKARNKGRRSFLVAADLQRWLELL